MGNSLKSMCLGLVLATLPFAASWADGEAPATAAAAEVIVAPEAAATDTAADADHKVVEASLDGNQVVKVNTGNQAVDEAANLAARCAEKSAAMHACGSGFKAMACRKGLELTRYKGLVCPSL